jgi:hypothetical protein
MTCRRHTVMKPDRAGLSYFLEEGRFHSVNNKALPIRGVVFPLSDCTLTVLRPAPLERE